jgi:PEP-CTERM motif
MESREQKESVMRQWIWRLVAVVVVTASGARASAGLLPVSVTVIPQADQYRWTYNIVLPTDSQLRTGNYFTIYDFHGYVAGGEEGPDGWTFSASNTGPTPDRLRPSDDPAVTNLTWTYSGPTIPSGQTGLGNFWAISTVGDTGTDSFTATTMRTSDGAVDSNITETEVPVGTPVVNRIPEPTTLLMAGLGLPLVGLIRKRRRA